MGEQERWSFPMSMRPPIRVPIREACSRVQRKVEFIGSNTAGRLQRVYYPTTLSPNGVDVEGGTRMVYIVSSYAVPIYVFDFEQEVWCGNSEGYSVTTAKHKGQLRPSSNIVWLSERGLRDVINKGFVRARLEGAQ